MITWEPTTDRAFSIKTSNKSCKTNNVLMSWLWKTKLPSYIKNFIWETLFDALPTTKNLNRF